MTDKTDVTLTKNRLADAILLAADVPQTIRRTLMLVLSYACADYAYMLTSSSDKEANDATGRVLLRLGDAIDSNPAGLESLAGYFHEKWNKAADDDSATLYSGMVSLAESARIDSEIRRKV